MNLTNAPSLNIDQTQMTLLTSAERVACLHVTSRSQKIEALLEMDEESLYAAFSGPADTLISDTSFQNLDVYERVFLLVSSQDNKSKVEWVSELGKIYWTSSATPFVQNFQVTYRKLRKLQIELDFSDLGWSLDCHSLRVAKEDYFRKRELGVSIAHRIFFELGYSIDSIPHSLNFSRQDGIEDLDVPSDLLYLGVSETTRDQLIAARKGQGIYRQNLFEVWGGRCAVTGCNISEMLIASHALPWSLCKNNVERLDKYNGLLLAAHVDRLFDVGLISFDAEGRILWKPRIDMETLKPLGISSETRLVCIHSSHLPYLSMHRRIFGFEQG